MNVIHSGQYPPDKIKIWNKKLFPALQFVFNLGQQAAVEDGLLDAVAFLCAVVVEQPEHILAQGDDGDEVAGGEDGHAEVTEVPYHIEADHGAKYHHHPSGTNAVDGDDGVVGGHETDVRLTVIIIADDRREGEEQDGEENGKDVCYPFLMQSFLDIVCRTADEMVFVAFLEELAEGRLHKGSGSADEGDDPHPEHGSRSANRYGCGYSCQVSRPHPGSHRHGESLEG